MASVFLDLGTHFGQGLKEFIYKFNMDNNWIIHTFEANPDTYKMFLDSYANQIELPFTHHNAAVSNKEGTLEINMETPPTNEGDTGMGSSVMPLTEWQPWGGRLEFGAKKSVPAIDFSKFLRDNFSPDDSIVVKMDIEGSEYDVLEGLIASDTLKYIKVLAIEWHSHMFTNPTAYAEREAKIKQIMVEQNIAFGEWK